MTTERFVITDRQWALMEPHCLGKETDPNRTGSASRLFLEAVLWITRTDSPWRDLPAHFGKWNSVFNTVSRLGEGRCIPTPIQRRVG